MESRPELYQDTRTFSDDPLIHRWIAAAERGDIHFILERLESEIAVDVRANCGWTALMWASEGGHLDLMKLLLDRGADPNLSSNWHGPEHYPLTYAAWLARPASVSFPRIADLRPAELLLASGAEFHLLEAVLLNRVDIAREHLDRDEDVDAGEWCYHGPLLMQAACYGYLEMVELLLDHGARIEATDDLNQTSLVEAAATGRFEVVELLLNRGANVNATDVWDRTVLAIAELEWAGQDGHESVLELLRKAGADR